MIVFNNWLSLHPQSGIVSKMAQASISPDNRGLGYADGFFTTMGVMDGIILWQDYHQQRLISHAQALQLDINSKALLASLQAYAQQLQQGIIKLIVTRTAQAIRGYGFSADAAGRSCDIWLKASAITIATSEHLYLPNGRAVLKQPATYAVCLRSQIACLPPTLAGLKTLNRLDNVLASGELEHIRASSAHADEKLGEGLLRDISGNWVEGTMSNVFYQLDPTQNHNHANHSNYLTQGQWYTPSMSQSGVAGVMRQVLLDALKPTDNPVIIRPLTDEDLPKLSQLFFCNAVRGVMPVSRIRLLNGEVIDF